MNCICACNLYKVCTQFLVSRHSVVLVRIPLTLSDRVCCWICLQSLVDASVAVISWLRKPPPDWTKSAPSQCNRPPLLYIYMWKQQQSLYMIIIIFWYLVLFIKMLRPPNTVMMKTSLITTPEIIYWRDLITN